MVLVPEMASACYVEGVIQRWINALVSQAERNEPTVLAVNVILCAETES